MRRREWRWKIAGRRGRCKGNKKTRHHVWHWVRPKVASHLSLISHRLVNDGLLLLLHSSDCRTRLDHFFASRLLPFIFHRLLNHFFACPTHLDFAIGFQKCTSRNRHIFDQVLEYRTSRRKVSGGI